MKNSRTEQAAVQEMDQRARLEELLSLWHFHCKTYNPVPTKSADPMFKQALRAKGEQTLDAIREDQAHKFEMEAMDFHVYELEESRERPLRSAILVAARNAYTGHSVWISPRLPPDPFDRAEVIAEARRQLTRRLCACGVM